MSVITGIKVLDGMFSEEQVKQLETAASVHLAQSNIEFSILQAEQDIIHVEVAQNATRSGKYATEATLIKRAHEVFDKVLPGIKLEIEPSTHMPSPTSVVNPSWLEMKMKAKGLRIKQIAFDTGIDREIIADWVAGKRNMSQIVKAMFYFYFSK
jgi:hypothetical protein